MNRLGRYLMPFAAAAMLGGCGVKESFKDAEIEVGKFHQALDAGQWQQIWTKADPQLRETTQRPQFEKFLDAVHRKLGKVREAKQVGWNANATTGGSFVTLTYQTTFEHGSGVEQFVYRKGDGGGMTLVGYNIDSQDMMLN
ncbi:MAG: DUF4019 domain-containing protein [Novosphingobium sp.]|uniref:DUF4019 domain-containing protein n=2 Tax=Novosphingobium TaxID=165696 RepID=UPI0006C881CD|nr:DUF4019 domain-containing protein [Novosphingobium sp. ST904]KPH60486.1 hypothetical protein ADT71_20425 [Novosphingobium sp. ST904]MPS67006.1 DUF4019 domain-containing protein [Novosphingobium sp.]